MRRAHQAVDTGPRADSMPFERRRDSDVRAERPSATNRLIVASSGFFPAAGEQPSPRR